MIGVPGMTSTRRVMKVEKPRPLKISNIGDHSMETVLSEMDIVSQKLNGSTYDRSTCSQIASLCENLKMFGPQLESVYKDQLDRCYVALRNGCRDDRLTLASRYRLLEVIELRAMNWQPNENLINYYKQKLAQIEVEESCVEESHGSDINGYLNTGAVLTPTAPVSAPVFPGQYPAYPSQQIAYTPQSQQPLPQVVPPTPPVLGPGEIVKSSGKYVAPVRVPGKNHCKDEIVIRNADSGKVMGLKGRRVHMIEELSETVISFQRVAPGARERLVQITGTNEENINQAKHLIEETIRRNASPIRSEERGSLVSHGGSCSSISSHASDETLQGSKRTSMAGAPIEEGLGDYRYTVTHENDTIRITGNNLELVRTAKLILDEYFNGEKNLNISSSSSLETDSSTTVSPSQKDSPSVSSSVEKPLVDEHHSPSEEGASEASKSSVVTVLRQPLIPSSSKEMIESVESGNSHDLNKNVKNRRMLFAKTNEEKNIQQATEDVVSPLASGPCNPPPANPPTRIIYSREFLVRCAASPLCRLTPANWAQVVRLSPSIVKKDVDYANPTELFASELRWSCLRTTSVADDDDNGNSNSGAPERNRSSTEERT